MEKYLNYTGLLAILLFVVAIVMRIVPIDGDAGLFYTLSAILTTFVYTPLFFVNHKKVYDAYKVPCYIASTLVAILLIFGSWLAGATNSFGEPNFYTGSFMVLCYMIVMLLFKPSRKQSSIVISISILMVIGLATSLLVNGVI